MYSVYSGAWLARSKPVGLLTCKYTHKHSIPKFPLPKILQVSAYNDVSWNVCLTSPEISVTQLKFGKSMMVSFVFIEMRVCCIIKYKVVGKSNFI